jgi:coniferyl-aldehyde dehydrogenase
MQNPGAELARLFERQRAAHLATASVPARTRIDRLQRALDLLVTHQGDFCQAAASDFGQRPSAVTQFMDLVPAVLALKYARRHVRRWMRPQRYRVGWPFGVPGVRAEVVRQPLGVVGLISPWNFPVNLTFGPLAGILAAGNRCLIKPSEVTPAVSALMQRLVAQAFDPSEVSVVTGGPEIAQAFSQLPFDHLLFTGSTAIGQRVMAAAAANLVPVTLELGGKCPVVVGRSAVLARTVGRILLAKLANAGQMCIAPDYVYLPHDSIDSFVREARRWMQSAYPVVPGNPDYTGLINEQHALRAAQLLADAQAKGAQIVELWAAPGGAGERRLMTPTLILGATDDMRVMQEEIFAPILPLRSYERIEQVISDINGRPHALALYYFGSDPAEQAEVLARTRSGGVTVNDIAMHFLAESLPFGGVGASGIGAYHGEEGFRRFSHARSVFHQTRLDVAGLIGLRPPYGRRLSWMLKLLIRR